VAHSKTRWWFFIAAAYDSLQKDRPSTKVLDTHQYVAPRRTRRVGQTDPREVVSGAQQETLQKDFQATTRRMSEMLLASDIYLAPYVANTKPEVK
jgi:hypothetical protein